MDYKIIHADSSIPYIYDDREWTTTTIVRGDTLSINDQGHLLVEHIREQENGEHYKTVNAIFKTWYYAYPIPIENMLSKS